MRQQLRYMGIAAYSLVVLATTIPSVRDVPNTVVLPYFAIVPGYCVTFLLNRQASSLERLFYSIAWNLALLTGVISLESFNPGLPISVIVPVVTLVVLGYNYLHDR